MVMQDMVLNFGKHKGLKLSECPQDYVRWLSEQATICGKKDIPQVAKALLDNKPAPTAHSDGTKECMSCCKPIHGEAIPVRETYQHRTYTKYLHRHCAEQLAQED